MDIEKIDPLTNCSIHLTWMSMGAHRHEQELKLKIVIGIANKKCN